MDGEGKEGSVAAIEVVVSGGEGRPSGRLDKAGDADPELYTTWVRLGESGTKGSGLVSYENQEKESNCSPSVKESIGMRSGEIRN